MGTMFETTSLTYCMSCSNTEIGTQLYLLCVEAKFPLEYLSCYTLCKLKVYGIADEGEVLEFF